MPYREDASSSCFTGLTSSSSFPAQPSMPSVNLRLLIVRPPMLTVGHDSFKENFEQCRRQQISLSDSNWCMEPLPYHALYKYCTGGLCVKFLDDVDKLLAIYLLYMYTHTDDVEKNYIACQNGYYYFFIFFACCCFLFFFFINIATLL